MCICTAAKQQSLYRQRSARHLRFWLPRLPRTLPCRWRVPIIFLDNILQVGLGCYTHETIYPETGVTR